MRQKDANLAAWLLGRSRRFAQQPEIAGLEVAYGEIGSHMQHVNPDFDRNAYDAAFRRGLNGEEPER